MKKLGLERLLERLSLPVCSGSSCFCVNYEEDQDDGSERRALMASAQMAQLKQLFQGNKSLAFHLQPKTVVLRVSMHCNGCARKVEKHISKMDGVTSFEVDLERKKVVVMGDITPFEVLESISKIKFAELWVAPPCNE